MPKNIRLSGAVDDSYPKEIREFRAKLLYHLFAAGFNIYNGNGDQDVTLWNIQKKLIEANGFVFMPGVKLDDIIKASSIFVGYQTGDRTLNGKPSVMLNPRDSWTQWLKLIDHLHEMGTVSQNWRNILTIVKKPKDVVAALEKQTLAIEAIRTSYDIPPAKSIPGDNKRRKPRKSICVFCSASTTDKDFLQQGYNLGKQIAEKKWGCISGAGRTGIMGEVVRGAYENNGWTGGSNIPHIIKLEGLPDGLNAFWPSSDIYKRMEIMIRHSDGFVVMPGGMGTVQEMLVLLDLKHKNDKLMKGKNVVLFNPKTKNKRGQSVRFWDPLIKLTKDHKVHKFYKVQNTLDNIISLLEQK